eukprot:TRINITY_DN528_c0_g1_i2.p1 TRINITY_DN528_c0_g1~~TRINITY_DN528_c0_g1_i2.p1  ORF type:complete len:308 (+),score=123.29 TRINITY_DN528_c0_g1_i2:27-950(+)
MSLEKTKKLTASPETLSKRKFVRVQKDNKIGENSESLSSELETNIDTKYNFFDSGQLLFDPNLICPNLESDNLDKKPRYDFNQNGDKTNGDKTNDDKTNDDKTNDDKTNDDKTNGDKTNEKKFQLNFTHNNTTSQSNDFLFFTNGSTFASIGANGQIFGLSEKDNSNENEEKKLFDSTKQSNLAPIEIETGEESEEKIFSAKVRLFIWEKKEDQSTWKERGFGTIKLNGTKNSESQKKYRLIMRIDGSLKLILNCFLFPSMTCEPSGELGVRIIVITDSKPELHFIKLQSNAEQKELIKLINTHKKS